MTAGSESRVAERVGRLLGASRGWMRSRRKRGLATVIAAFVGSRIVYAIAGLRFIGTGLGFDGGAPSWQILDPDLLHHDLFRSLWYLHSEPPLFNLYCGILLHLPTGWRSPVWSASYVVLGLVIVVTTYLLFLELAIPCGVSTVMTLVVVADPAMVLFEHLLSDTYPTTALVMLGMYACVRLSKRPTVGLAFVTSGAIATVVLLVSHFQWPWVAAVLAVMGVALRRHWRVLVVGAALPTLVVLGWYVKDIAVFGSTSTTSWTGMNLAEATTMRASTREIDGLIKDGTLTPIAGVHPFSFPRWYVPRYASLPDTGIPALDELRETNGEVNYNNLLYVSVSGQYLHDDVAFILAKPGEYVRNISMAVPVFTYPPDQFYSLVPNYQKVSGYARAWDAIVLLQPRFKHHWGYAYFDPSQLARRWSHVSVTIALLLLIALIGGARLVLRRRQDAAQMAALGVMWITVLYVFVVASLAESGENMRFASELGSLPLVLAVAVVADIVRQATKGNRRRRSLPRSGTPQTSKGRRDRPRTLRPRIKPVTMVLAPARRARQVPGVSVPRLGGFGT